MLKAFRCHPLPWRCSPLPWSPWGHRFALYTHHPDTAVDSRPLKHAVHSDTHLSVQAAPAWNTAPQPSPLLRPAMPLIPQGPNQRPLSSRVTFSPALGREFSSSKLALFVPPIERAPRSRLTCTDELGRRSSERLLRAEILTYPCLVITSKVRRREKKRWPWRQCRREVPGNMAEREGH